MSWKEEYIKAIDEIDGEIYMEVENGNMENYQLLMKDKEELMNQIIHSDKMEQQVKEEILHYIVEKNKKIENKIKENLHTFHQILKSDHKKQRAIQGYQEFNKK